MTTIDQPRAFTSLESLDYEAPFLIEKLVLNAIADSAEEAEALFREVKRYLVLADLDQDHGWNMYSLRVDEAWHQFILFTRQYIEFSQRYFGRYVSHNPSNAPKVDYGRTLETTTFVDFQRRYQELYGERLPDIWYDESTVTLDRRLISRWAAPLTVRADGEMVELVNARGSVVLTVNDLARAALDFIAATDAFYVRELPGGLTDDEKVALAAALVECKVLRAAS